MIVYFLKEILGLFFLDIIDSFSFIMFIGFNRYFLGLKIYKLIEWG